MRRLLPILALAGLLLAVFTASASAAPHCALGQEPTFVFGFANLKSLLGDKMEEPLECEHANPENGDSLQQTTTGLAFYRKSTNIPTFTDGFNHWGWRVEGLVYWTGDAVDAPGYEPPPTPTPSATPVPNPIPTATPTPSGTVTPTSTPIPSFNIVPGDIDSQENFDWMKLVATECLSDAEAFLGPPSRRTLTINVGPQYSPRSRGGSVQLRSSNVGSHTWTTCVESVQAMWRQLRSAEQWFFKGTSNMVANRLLDGLSDRFGTEERSGSAAYQDDLETLVLSMLRGDELAFAPLSRFTWDLTGNDGTRHEYVFGKVKGHVFVTDMLRKYLGGDGMSAAYKELFAGPRLTDQRISEVLRKHVPADKLTDFSNEFTQRVFIADVPG